MPTGSLGQVGAASVEPPACWGMPRAHLFWYHFPHWQGPTEDTTWRGAAYRYRAPAQARALVNISLCCRAARSPMAVCVPMTTAGFPIPGQCRNYKRIPGEAAHESRAEGWEGPCSTAEQSLPHQGPGAHTCYLPLLFWVPPCTCSAGLAFPAPSPSSSLATHHKAWPCSALLCMCWSQSMNRHFRSPLPPHTKQQATKQSSRLDWHRARRQRGPCWALDRQAGYSVHGPGHPTASCSHLYSSSAASLPARPRQNYPILTGLQQILDKPASRIGNGEARPIAPYLEGPGVLVTAPPTPPPPQDRIHAGVGL